MSTKLHDGYRIHGDLNDAYAACAALRAFVQRRAVAELPALVARFAVEQIDKPAMGDVRWTHAPLQWAASELRQRWGAIGERSVRDPEVDFGARVILAPRPRYESETLARVVALHDPIVRAWDALTVPAKRPWPYWNNADPPRGITVDVWAERGREWDAWLEQPPFVFDCLPALPPFPSAAAVLRAVPSFERRVRDAAMGSVQAPAGLPFCAVPDWLNGRDGRRALLAAMAKARKALPRRITRGMLLGPEARGR